MSLEKVVKLSVGMSVDSLGVKQAENMSLYLIIISKSLNIHMVYDEIGENSGQ